MNVHLLVAHCTAPMQHYNNTWEEEPEWMEFGPNDRFELIELKGLEEHEREREGMSEDVLGFCQCHT